MWSGSAVSNLGDGIRLTALPLMAATLTRDPVAIGAVTAATLAPWVVVGPVGGALADRTDRRTLIVAGQLLRGLAVGLFAVAVALGHADLALLYLVAFVIGMGEVAVDSAAQAAVPSLAPPDQLERANSRLIAVEVVTNNVAGGPLGGLLFAAGAALPFGVDAASFVLGAGLVLLIRRPLQAPRQPRAATGIWVDVKEGFSYLWDSVLLRGLAAGIAVVNLALTGATSLLVLLALDDLGMTEVGFGVLMGIGAVGGVIGSLAADGPVRWWGRRTVVVTATAVEAAALAVIGAAPGPIVAAVGVFLVSLGVGLFNVVGRALRQAVVPDRLLGRVVASFRVIGFGAIPLGAVLGGGLASVTSVRATFYAAAVVSGAAAVGLHKLLTPERLGGR